jgi:hypothetical protein
MKEAPTVSRTERERTVKLTVTVPVRGMASWAYPAKRCTAKMARATPRVPPIRERMATSARADCRRWVVEETGELRVGQINARDEEHAEDGGHEEPEPGGGAAYDDLLERLDVHGERAPGRAIQLVGGNLVGDIVGNDVEIFGGLGDRYAGLQMAEYDEVAVVAVPAEVSGGIDGQRGDDLVVGELASEWGCCEFVCLGEVEALGEDADDLEGGSGYLNGSSDDGRVAVEEGLPETVADDGYVLVAFDGLFGQEVSA